MNDLTDLKYFLGSLFRPLIKQAVDEALADKNFAVALAPDSEPFGDFKWLCATVPAPPSTLRIKSAAGEIPGVKKFGKRVLYEKATVLNWLRGQTQQPTPGAAELEQFADAQVNAQLQKRAKRTTRPTTARP